MNICNATNQATFKWPILRTCLPVFGFDIHSFKDRFIVDGCDGFPTFSHCFLARQGNTVKDNDFVLSVRVW